MALICWDLSVHHLHRRRWVKWPQNKPEAQSDLQSGNISLRGLGSFSLLRRLQEKWAFFQKPSWGRKKQWSRFGIRSDQLLADIMCLEMGLASSPSVCLMHELWSATKNRNEERYGYEKHRCTVKVPQTDVTLIRWTDARIRDVPSRTSALRLCLET